MISWAFAKSCKCYHSNGVDWTDPSAWPEECVDDHWERQLPIPFLLKKCDSDKGASTLR